jgi:hypothetical protein
VGHLRVGIGRCLSTSLEPFGATVLAAAQRFDLMTNIYYLLSRI